MADQEENDQKPNQGYSFPQDGRNSMHSQEEERRNRQRIQHFNHGSPQMGMGIMHQQQQQQQHQRQQPPPAMGAIPGLPAGFNNHYPAGSVDNSRHYYSQGPVAYLPNMNVYNPNGQPLAMPRFDNNGAPSFMNPFQPDGFSISPEYARPRENAYGSPNLPQPYYPEGDQPRAIPQMDSSPPDENQQQNKVEEYASDENALEGESASEYKPSPLKKATPRPHTGGKYPRKTVPETPKTSHKKTPRQGQSAKKTGAKPTWQGNFSSIDSVNIAKRTRAQALKTATNSNDKAAAIPDLKQRPGYAKRLFDAIVYTDPEECKDHPDNNERKISQALNAIERGAWPAEHIEERCWEILEALIDRGSSYGVRLLPPLHRMPHETNARHRGFEERFAAIEDALKQSKATCKNVLDPQGHIDKLVDAPQALIRQKENNKKVNGQRDFQNRIGRTAIKRGIKTTEELQDVLPSEDDEPQTPEEDTKPVMSTRSLKRPRPSTTHTPRIYNDTDEKNDDEVNESPTKKPFLARNRVSAAKSSPVGGSAGKTIGDNAMNLRRSKRNNPGPPPPPGMEDNYKAILAGLLEIDMDFARQYELRDLRIYARAYYDSMNPWDHPDDARYFSPRGPFMALVTSSNRKRHLAHVTNRFMNLAVERNDDMENQGNLRFISPVTTVPEKQALGMIENPFGTVPGLY